MSKICVITDIDPKNRYEAKRNFDAVKKVVFEGLSLGMFHRRDYYNLRPQQRQALVDSVKFTTCHSAISKDKPGTGYDMLVLIGRCSLALYGPDLKEKQLKEWYGRVFETGVGGQQAIVLPPSYNMSQWVQNATHKASEKGMNRATHYVRTAYQTLTDTVPHSTRTAIKFTLNVDDICQMVRHVQATKYMAFDVETFPAERNVPTEKRLEVNTTFFRAKCRTLQISHQAGAAYTVPVYDFESPLNVGKDDNIEVGVLIDLGEKDEDGKDCKSFTPFPNVESIPDSMDVHVRRNGEVVTTYDWHELPFERDVATALVENWQTCKAEGIDNYFRDVCFPEIQVLFADPNIRKVAHNVTFDWNVLRYPGQGLGFELVGLFDDTMEQIHTLDKSKPMGLKPLSELYYPEFIGYGDDIDYENDPLLPIGTYGGTDTDLTARLDIFMLHDFQHDPRLFNFYLNAKQPNMFFFGDLEYNGCFIDRQQLKKTKDHTTKKANIFLDRLNNIPEVVEYVRERLKKEREQAIKIVDLKLAEWVEKNEPKVEARIKKAEEEGKAYKANGEPYKPYTDNLAKLAWIRKGVKEKWFDPLHPGAYKRPLDLQNERTAIQTGQAEKAYLFDLKPSASQREKGTYYRVAGQNLYITSSKKPLFRGMNYKSADHLGDFVYLSKYGLQNEMPFTTAKETDPETGRKKNVRKQRPTTTRKEITTLDDPTGFLENLMIYKALLYVLQSCEEIEERLDAQGRIHTQYGYVDTDRSKSSRPNLQNVMQRSPFEVVRECVKMYKKMFCVPDGDTDKWLYYKRDLSQAELRWFCFVYRILSMATAYDNDEDLHEKTAAKIMGMTQEAFRQLPKHEYKLNRTNIGKGNNFGNIYGISDKGFQDYVRLMLGYVIDILEARRQQNEFFDLYKEIRPAHDKQKALIHRLGYSETPFGNRRPLPDLQSDIPYFQAEAERQGVNQPVQGAAGVAMMISGVTFKLRSVVCGFEGYTQNLIHDDLPGVCTIEESLRYQIELRQACNRPPFLQYFGFEMDIAKMKSDGEVGLNWAQVEELPDVIKDMNKEREKEGKPALDLKETEDILFHMFPGRVKLPDPGIEDLIRGYNEM